METKLVNVLKGNTVQFPHSNLCIHELFEREVEKNPNNTSVIYEDVSLTYSQLNEKANRLANYLLAHGLQKEEPVAVFLERSIEMVIALLGILKAGGVYVPIEPTHPSQRIHLILQSLDSPFVICTTDNQPHFETGDAGRPILIDQSERWHAVNAENPNVAINQNDSMYIIFTSGTTGKPKGVINRHRGLNNRIQWMQKQFKLTSEDRLLQKTPYTFDVSVWEFFWPLISGAAIVMAKPQGHKDPEYILETIKKYQITTIHFVPSMLQLFLDFIPKGESLPLKRVICGGEPLKKTTELQFFSKTKEVGLYNLYGPSEASISVTFWECTGSKEESRVPIGYPISNINLYVMDEQLNTVKPLEAGELYIGGIAPGKGYFNQQALTEEVFIVNPLDENEILYKTGDICRYRPDGALEYIGRNDFQVKLRGNRIELTEIEYTFEKQPNIKECIVCGVNEGENQYLVAYVTIENEEWWDETELRNALKEHLPEYMLPSFIVKIKEFPLSNNGKIDRKQLPNPMESQKKREESSEPVTETEKAVSEVWSELLGRDNIGLDEPFLYVGGNSILAARLVARLKKKFSTELTLNDVFKNPTIKTLSNYIDCSSSQYEYENYIDRDVEIKSELSYTQNRMWFINELEGLSSLYNIPGYVDLKGSINIDAFKESLDFMIEQNSILQCNFKSESGKPYIYRDSAKKSELRYFNISEHNLVQAQKIAMKEIRKDAAIPFDLAHDHLFRFHIYKLSKHHYRFYYNFHHIIFDGWSESVFINNLLRCYHRKTDGSRENINLNFAQYEDYIKHQKEFMESKSYSKQLDYWKEKLDGNTANIKLSHEQKERSPSGYEGEALLFDFNDADIKQFERYCKGKGATLFMGMLALYKLFIYRMSNETDLSVGIPIAGRNEEEFENVIGMFINTLTIHNNLEKGLTFKDFLAEVKQTVLDALSNGEVPFEKVVEAVQPNRVANHNPLFQYMFVFQNFPKSEREIGNLTIEGPTSINNGTSKFDLTLFIEMDDEKLTGKWEYRKDVFNQSIIDSFTKVFQQLLKSVNAQPEARIEKLPILTAVEESDLIYKWNETARDFPNVCLHELFEEQVKKTPDNIAAEYEGEILTYKQLDEKSNQLAHFLIEKGVVPDTPVGIMIERSLNLVVSMLGILKAGGAYLPIEVGTPVNRAENILLNAEALLCVTDQQLSFQHKKINKIHSSDLEGLDNYSSTKPNVHLSPLNLVSVYYTSGSTGNPKGVSSTHQGWVNRMCWMQNTHRLKEKETVLQKTTLTFDDAAVEFFWPLMVGGKIALIPPETHKDPNEIINYAIQYNVSVLQFVPSMLKLVTSYITAEQKRNMTNLRVVVSSGEALTADLVNDFYTTMPGTLYNSWGATEVSIDSTCYKCSPDKLTATGSQIISVGKPIDNNRIYVLDEYEKAVPIGVPGDLYIAGIGLARGYLNDSEKTRTSFIADPFFKNERMYKTGDRGYLSSDGNIMFIGREDNQIKIRGMRVELGEIENRIREINGIKEAVVLLTKYESDSQLVAYYTKDNEVNKDTIKNKLGKELPGYMVPSFYMELETIPLNSNGKLDRKSLPKPTEEDLILSSNFSKPTNSIEERVLSIWKKQLKLNQIGIHDNFFELGGHSLLAVQIISAINKEFVTSISVKALFDNPTIALMSELLHQQEEQILSITPFEKIDKSKSIPLSDAQRRIWFLDNLNKGTEYNMSLVLEIKGSIDSEKMENTIIRLMMRHEALRTTFSNHLGTPSQIVHDQLAFELEVDHAINDDIQSIIQREARNEFDLSKGPLFKAKLIKRTSNDVLVMIFHHIICDGWSLNILKEELVNLYNDEKLSEDPVQYPDYAVYQQKFANTTEFKRQLSYWMRQMGGELPLLQLPQDNWQENQKKKNITIKYSLSKHKSEQVRLFSKERKYTPFMTFLGAYSILLSRLSQQSDVVIGTPLVNRKISELESAVGMFLNTLPLRINADKKNTFGDYLESVKEVVLDAFDNQDIPFEKIVEKVQPERNLNRNPLFDVLINYQSYGDEKEYRLGEYGLKELEVEEIESKFLITLYIKDTHAGFQMNLSYRNNLFSEERMKEFLNQYLHLLDQIIKDQNLQLGEMDLVTKEIHKSLPDPQAPLEEIAYQRVTETIENIVNDYPEQLVVEEGERAFTYQELGQDYHRIAKNLVSIGIQPGDVVAVYGNRSYKTIAAILGVLFADAVFLTIDEGVPANGMKKMLKQSNTKLILATQTLISDHLSIVEQLEVPVCSHHEYLQQNKTKEIADHTANKLSDKRAAYIFFTSGTTGESKAVLGSHNGLSHFLEWQRTEFGISSKDRFAQLTNVTFDVYLRDIFLPLTSGATICIPKKGEEVITFLQEKKITALHTVASLARTWMAEGEKDYYLKELRYVFFAGEPLPNKVVEVWQDISPAEVISLYGQTETTLAKAYQRVNKSNQYETIPLGKPLPDTQIYILNNQNRICGVGETGEIIVRTPYHSIGYLQQGSLFTKNIISDDLGYRTGDLGRYLPDGNIQILGRNDDQLKLRGVRINKNEIISAVNRIKNVKESYIISKAINEDTQLSAYVVFEDEPMSEKEIRMELLKELPMAMIPASFITVSHIPVTKNGKVDKEKLSSLKPKASNLAYPVVSPIEIQLTEIWKKVLSIDEIKSTDNFFELGGHSLLIVKMLAMIKEKTGREISLMAVFLNPTISSLAASIEKESKTKQRPAIRKVKRIIQSTKRT